MENAGNLDKCLLVNYLLADVRWLNTCAIFLSGLLVCNLLTGSYMSNDFQG